jgi:type I restriction enzyme M protein
MSVIFPIHLDILYHFRGTLHTDGQLTVQKRIGKIFERVKKRHGKIFDANDEIKLSPRSLAYIVSELQPYSLLNTKIDIRAKPMRKL